MKHLIYISQQLFNGGIKNVLNNLPNSQLIGNGALLVT